MRGDRVSPDLLFGYLLDPCAAAGLLGGGNVGEEIVKCSLEGLQLGLDLLEALNGLEALVHTAAVMPDLSLGGIQLQALLLDQVIHLADDFDVVGRVVADVFLVALGADDRELRLPVAQGGLGDSKNLRNITDFVEFFVQFLHGLAQINRNIYLCKLIITLQR